MVLEGRTPRMTTSTKGCLSSDALKRERKEAARAEVCVSVVLQENSNQRMVQAFGLESMGGRYSFAKSPLRAANAPLVRARRIQREWRGWFLGWS